jgi:hypothetical protein
MTVAAIKRGVTIMMRLKAFPCGAILVCSVLILAGFGAWADDKKEKEKPAFSGIWELKGGETKIEFTGKKVVKIAPHGDSAVIAIVCEYSVEKDGVVKVKITEFEGKDEAKEHVKGILPVGTEFSFKWKVKDDTAKLADVKGEKVEALKSHLEGDYNKKK